MPTEQAQGVPIITAFRSSRAVTVVLCQQHQGAQAWWSTVHWSLASASAASLRRLAWSCPIQLGLM